MSKQSFGEFLATLQQDEGLRKELEAKLGSVGAGVPAAALAQFAQDKGYCFSVEEVAGELSDEELGAVSGGLLPAVNTKIYPKIDSYSLGGNTMIKIDYSYFKLF